MKRLRIGRKTLFIVIGILVLFIPIYGFGQQDGFSISATGKGDIYLSLGMSENIVIEELKLKGFLVGLISFSDSNTHDYAISVKTRDSVGDLYDCLGSIRFTNKKITSMSRKWYPTPAYIGANAQTFDLADKLYHLLNQEIEKGGKGELRATIKASSHRNPDAEFKNIAIIAGNKKISLLIVESEKEEWGRQVNIIEEISDNPFNY